MTSTPATDGFSSWNIMRDVTNEMSVSATKREISLDHVQCLQSFSQEENGYHGTSLAELNNAIDSTKQQVSDLSHLHREVLHRFHTDIKHLQRALQQSKNENSMLRKMHHDTIIELERWRMECQDLKHRLGLTDTSSLNPINTISRERYNDLERRHRLLHKEFDELRSEKAEVERQLHSTQKVLNTIGNGLDYLGRELPLLCPPNTTHDV
ncbi:uncharacterized protein TM35_000044070 [Trypanosoma theileri]|uniref:Uncharacterized protein n=1 Tax=Trypanosoma theileri TaxID=67003 RepID=A0A1X0P6C9_9TRYP|nr:uncharacterized protein TM35_000044070 [Trypanosoma theileri]ORC92193.1 hypothetical protein TM35_000044070 [Trypanosoma theileri]